MHPNPPSTSARLGAGTAAAVVVAVAHVVSECCVRASNFMKTNPLQNKRAKESERPTHGLESGSDRGKKGEYIRAAARVSISERGSWEIKAFNYVEEGREKVEARFIRARQSKKHDILGRPDKPKNVLVKQNMHRYFLEGAIRFPDSPPAQTREN